MEKTEMFIIALVCLIAVFAVIVLYALTIVIKLNGIVKESNLEEKAVSKENVYAYNKNEETESLAVQTFDEDDEEERLVAALAASAVAASDKPDSHFNIKKITRIK
jgi:hypothetical protein